MNSLNATWLFCFATLLMVSISSDAHAQSYGRTTNSGDWNDSNWINDSGTTGVKPGNNDLVYIGNESEVSGSVEPASVDVTTSETVDFVALGDVADVNSSGTVRIRNNGSLTTQNVDVQNGLLDVQSGGSLTATDIVLFGATSNAVFDGNLNISGSVFAYAGAVADFNSAVIVDGITAQNGVINANASITANFGIDVNGTGEFNMNADTFSVGTFVTGGTFNLNSGTLTTGDLFIDTPPGGSATMVNQNGGLFDASDLAVNGNGSITIGVDDNVSSSIFLTEGGSVTSGRALDLFFVNVFDTSSFTFTQANGQTIGLATDSLSIDPDSVMNILFDSTHVAGLDWGLCVDGDLTLDMQTWIDDGSLTFSGGTQPIEIIYDPGTHGDFTYLGYVNTVPEPSATVVWMASILILLQRRSRSASFRS